MSRNKLLWYLCVATVVFIVVITYTPLVIPAGQNEPFLLHLPYTLWVSILLTIALVVLTYYGIKLIPHDEEKEE